VGKRTEPRFWYKKGDLVPKGKVETNCEGLNLGKSFFSSLLRKGLRDAAGWGKGTIKRGMGRKGKSDAHVERGWKGKPRILQQGVEKSVYLLIQRALRNFSTKVKIWGNGSGESRDKG